MNFKKSLLAASFALTAIANAQEAPKFSLTGEFRPRSEYLGAGQSSTALDGSEGYVRTSVRAAINAKYTTEAYTTYIGFQEVFNLGDRTQIDAAGNGKFRVQEAWADVKLGENTSLKLGRQPLSYDDQRILGGLAWAQQARTHDAAVIKYKNNGYSLDLGGALNTTTDEIYSTLGAFSYRDMAFLRVNKKYDALNVSFLGMVNTFQDSSADKASLVTAGLHAGYKAGIVKLSANAYLQDGFRYDITGTATGIQKVEGAYLASLDAVIKASEKITVLAGGEIISGKDTAEGTFGFAPLYGTNHKFNGFMDRYYVGNYVNGFGLVDLNLGLKTKISGVALTVKAHNFTQQSGDKNDLGQEVDIVAAKKFKGFKLVGGYSQYFEPSGTTGKDVQAWAWAMLIIKPKFL